MAEKAGVEVGSGFIRVVAKTLDSDFQKWKKDWQKGIEKAMSGVRVSDPLVSDEEARKQGEEVGEKVADGAKEKVEEKAPEIVEPIGKEGPGIGATLGKAIVAGIIAGQFGALAGKAISAGLEQENGRASLQAQFGLSKEDAARFGEEAGNIYAEAYGESLSDVQGAIGAVISSFPNMRNASNEAVGEMTRKVLTLADTFGVDVARSTQVIGQLLKVGLVSDAAEATDLITASFQQVPVNVREDILDAADEYGPFFASLGIDGAQAFNLLTSAADRGTFGIDKTGDALKEFTIRATDMSKNTQAVYDSLGLDAEEYTNLLLSGGPAAEDAFNTIVEGLRSIEDPSAQAAAAIAIFGTPLEDLGVDQIPTFLKNISETNDVLGDFAGSTDEAAEALGGTLDSSLESIKREFNITLGEIALPLLQAVLPIVQDISAFFRDNSEAIATLGGPLLIIGGVLAGIVATMYAFQTVAAILAPAIAGIAAAQFTWNAALFANPLFLWITAIGLIIIGIIALATHWDQVTQFFANTINWVTNALNSLGDAFSNIFGGISNAFLGIGRLPGISIFGGLPGLAEGGLLKATPGGIPAILAEGGSNEIVMREGEYNANSAAQTALINDIREDGVGGNTQNNHFHNITDPNEVGAIVAAKWRQENGI